VVEAAIRFPERLHGREVEQLRLRAAMADPLVRVVVACGPAGMGKTALITDATTRAAGAGALTGAGKHILGDGGEDLSPFVEALEQAVSAGLDQLYDPQAGLEGLGHALGPKAAVFSTFGSGLLRSLDAGPLAQTDSVDAADERVVHACIATLHWLGGFAQPIILQIDDWGRASERATRLYERLIAEPDLEGFHLLASERPEEPSRLSFDHRCRRILVGPIGMEARRDIVSDMLGGAATDAGPLLDFIGPATERPFDLIQSLQSLAVSGGLVRDGEVWSLDPAVPADATVHVPEDIAVGLISGQPGQLAIARALAMLGDMASIDDLVAATGQAEPAAHRAIFALEISGLVRRRDQKLSLTHDRLRLAVLETLDPEARRELAATLADALLARGALPGQDPRGALMLRRRLEAGLEDVDAHTWAPLFQAGALGARQVGDRDAADAFAEAAMALAERGAGPSHAILKEAVFAAVERSDHALAVRRSDQMAAVASNAEERAEAEELRVFARRTSGDLAGAVDAARSALARAGIRIPIRPTALDVAGSVCAILLVSPKWARRQRPYTDQELAVAAPMMRATNATGSLLFEKDPWMAAMLASRSIPPSMAAGTSAGAGAYAYICSAAGLYRRAAQWAALSDLRQSPDQPLRAVGKQYSRAFGHLFVRPRKALLAAIDEVERLAYGEGDMAVAAYVNQDRIRESLMADVHLDQVIALSQRGQSVSARFRDIATNHPDAAMHQVAVNLRHGGDRPWRLAGDLFQPEAIEALAAQGLTNAIRLIAMFEAILAVSYGQYEAAVAVYERWRKQFQSAPFHGWTETWTFFTGLALYRAGGRPDGFALWNLRRLAKLNPPDKAHRTLLLKAEAARAARRPQRAMALYRQAVEAARNSNCLIEFGVTAEAAREGAALLKRADSDGFAEAALEAWTRLGADAVIASRSAAVTPVVSDELERLRAELVRLEARHDERERELETARLAAERANRAKSRFLATIGHELRTPLQGLVGLVDLAREADQALDVPALASVVGHVTAVVNDLTDLGALEGGVFPLAQVALDPAAVCRSVAMLHEPSLQGSARSIRLTLPQRQHLILGDEVRIRQIVSNLVGNAVKYAKGDIAVELEVQRRGQTAHVKISVSDQGPGLDPNALVRLFEPFERGLDTDGTDGLGLGLPLARALARRMAGDVIVNPTVAGGTRFSLVFDAERSRAMTARPSVVLSGVRVLLAEDSELSRRVLAALLRAQGCSVEEAPDGQAALALWRRQAFDLVLLDLRMPQLDGLSVARAIRNEEGVAGRASPIVMATAAATPDLESAAAGLGVAAVLQKPIGWRAIAEMLGRLPADRQALISERERMDELRIALGQDADGAFAEARQSAAAAVARIRDLAARGDHRSVETESHRLAGMASTFGLQLLARLALLVEADARVGTLDGLRIAELERAVQAN